VLPVALAAGIVLASPAGAAAATLDASRSCYFNAHVAELTGTGFAPNSPITFTVNGETVSQSVVSDSAGEVRVTYDPPRVRTGQRKLVIEATDSEDTSASTRIVVSRRRQVIASSDRSSDVRTWSAVFRLFGFHRGRAYIHYVNPDGRYKKTVRLGRLRGACGMLKTEERRVMPFHNPQFGRWRLQFDTRRRFDRDTENRRVIPVRIYRG
jgi:hypothetical protein